MPAITHRPTATKNATRFEENAFRLGSVFRAASRSILGSWHSRAFQSTRRPRSGTTNRARNNLDDKTGEIHCVTPPVDAQLSY